MSPRSLSPARAHRIDDNDDVAPVRAGGPALLRWLLGVVVLALIAGPMAPAIPSASALESGNVIVADEAGVLYLPQLDRDLAQIEFRDPTRVAIVTLRGKAGKGDDANLNEAVLNFAKAEHPEWLNADQQKWTDGLFILAFDVEDEKVGTYMGEDRKMSLGEQKSVQEATSEAFREARWTDGSIDGIRKAAELYKRPWYENPGWIFAGIVALIGGASAVIGILAVRAKRRREFDAALKRGDESYSSVTRDLEATELHASTIPESSSHGGRLLQKWSAFITEYHELTRMKSDLDDTSRRDRSNKPAVERAQDYERRIIRLDGLDDAIEDANALLNHYNGWDRAWRRQSGELIKQLDEAEEMIEQPETAGSEESRGAIRAVSRQIREDLRTWGGGLRDESLSGEQALDNLADAQRALGEALDQHADAVITDRADSSAEEELMRDALKTSREEGAGAQRDSSILRYSRPDMAFIPVWMYATGFSSGQSAVDSARSDATSGSTTGYGSSGGSFSGAGSSSSF